MKRFAQFVVIAALALVATVAASAQSTAVSPEHLTARQVRTLVASARTAEDHEQIARYYELKALEYRAKAQAHAVMLAYFMANNATNNEKNRFSTVNHCEYLFQSLNQRARVAHRLALEQERMAQDAAGE